MGTPIRCSISVKGDELSIPLEHRKITVGDDVWNGFGAIVYSGI
jgi:acetyltransferase-like isoleucine patch superfamily enzyme